MIGRSQYRPGKPAAVLGIFAGIGMLVLAVTTIGRSEKTPATVMVLWCIAVVAITGLNTWAAFAKNGSAVTSPPMPRPTNDEERK